MLFSVAIGQLRERGGTLERVADDWLEITYLLMDELQDTMPSMQGKL